ncbi:uncharacterized protein BX664DRAFT_334316 [Halteromyces radiatus]|uniref:uncharacterized protein n=1 Tax=Halteromyces radiatus TaxID=101107 RepID=UPI00221FD138|nr:uncharacterized protein BX664DRAFT_334316 [Halteromyces radiatus]KAI8089959.1 hypothetical protein BX664DRAFT_334316 [Halteromyces radiatus]
MMKNIIIRLVEEANARPSARGLSRLQQDIESTYSSEKHVQRRRTALKDRHCCIRCCCCACFPKWARYVIWTFIIAILIVIIIIGSIFATFKMPTFGFVGLADSNSSTLSTSNFQVNDGRFNFNFGLRINVYNPNIFPLHFSNMNATAYYPSDNNPDIKTLIGGGFLQSQWIPKQTNLTFTYPFQIEYDPSLDADQSVLNSLTDKCGLTGNPAQDLSIDYTIELAASALFVTLHPTIASSAQFPCPLNSEMLQGDTSG